MSSVRLKMLDGAERKFERQWGGGGAAIKSVRYETSFFVMTDEFDNETAIPVSLIAEVQVIPERRF